MGPLASDPISEQVANLSTTPMVLCPNDWVRGSAVQCGDMWGAVHTCHALSNEDFVDPPISFVGRDYKTMGRVVAGKARALHQPGGNGVECSGLGFWCIRPIVRSLSIRSCRVIDRGQLPDP